MLRVVIIFYFALKIGTAIDGVIWNKYKQDFVPIEFIYNISTYQLQKSCILNESRKLETYNFQNQKITIGYFNVSKNNN